MAHTSLHIAAPASLVWDVLTRIDLYAAWAPFTRSMKGDVPLRVGAPITESVELVLGQTQRQQPIVVTGVTPPSPGGEQGVLLWESIMGSVLVLHAVRTQTVTPDASGTGCTYVSIEAMSGALRPLVLCLYGAIVQRGFDDFARALKARCEERHRADGAK